MNSKEKKIQEEQTIDLLELFVHLLKKWYLLIACAVIGGLLAGYMTHTEVIPIYSASSMLFVAKTGTLESIYDLQFGQTMSEDFIEDSYEEEDEFVLLDLDEEVKAFYQRFIGIELTEEELENIYSGSGMREVKERKEQ